MKTDQTHTQLIIVGAGPAGAAAACFAAKAGLSTRVVERRPQPSDDDAADWLNPRGLELLGSADCDASSASLGTFSTIRFLEEGGARSSEAALPEPIHLLHTGRLTQVLLKSAAQRGAKLERGAEVARLDAGERRVEAVCRDGRRYAADLAMAAHGEGALEFGAARFDREALEAGRATCVECVRMRKATRGSARSAEPGRMTLIIDPRDPLSYGCLIETEGAEVAARVAARAGPDARQAFAARLAAWAERGWADRRWQPDPARLSMRRVPRGGALELETHVVKRCLLIGDAGGFVSALSHEGLHPGFCAAAIAVRVCREALAAVHPQDALAEFDAAWRSETADYIRMPNADLRFLLPLVFSNPQMARKLAGAFALGENI